jgi:hypothetical protein
MPRTWWEVRAAVVLYTAKLLRVRVRDMYDSYPYNPYSEEETREAWRNPSSKETADA